MQQPQVQQQKQQPQLFTNEELEHFHYLDQTIVKYMTQVLFDKQGNLTTIAQDISKKLGFDPSDLADKKFSMRDVEEHLEKKNRKLLANSSMASRLNLQSGGLSSEPSPPRVRTQIPSREGSPAKETVRELNEKERDIILQAKQVFHKKRRIFRFNQISELLDLKNEYTKLQKSMNSTVKRQGTLGKTGQKIRDQLDQEVVKKYTQIVSKQSSFVSKQLSGGASPESNHTPHKEGSAWAMLRNKRLSVQPIKMIAQKRLGSFNQGPATNLMARMSTTHNIFSLANLKGDMMNTEKSTSALPNTTKESQKPKKITSINGWFQNQFVDGIGSRNFHPAHQSAGNIKYQRALFSKKEDQVPSKKKLAPMTPAVTSTPKKGRELRQPRLSRPATQAALVKARAQQNMSPTKLSGYNSGMTNQRWKRTEANSRSVSNVKGEQASPRALENKQQTQPSAKKSPRRQVSSMDRNYLKLEMQAHCNHLNLEKKNFLKCETTMLNYQKKLDTINERNKLLEKEQQLITKDTKDKRDYFYQRNQETIQGTEKKSMSQYYKQVHDLKEITKPLYMGKPVHKITPSADNFYGKSSTFDLDNLKNLHDVFQQREHDRRSETPVDIEGPIQQPTRKLTKVFSGATSNTREQEEDRIPTAHQSGGTHYGQFNAIIGQGLSFDYQGGNSTNPDENQLDASTNLIRDTTQQQGMNLSSGLLTVPSFYHKGLNELLSDFDKKLEASQKNKEVYLKEKVKSKMKKQLEVVKEVYGKHQTIIKSQEMKLMQNKCELIQKIEKKRHERDTKMRKQLKEVHVRRSEKLERWQTNLKANRIEKLQELRENIIQKQSDIQDRIDQLKKERAIEIMEKKANLEEKVNCQTQQLERIKQDRLTYNEFMQRKMKNMATMRDLRKEHISKRGEENRYKQWKHVTQKMTMKEDLKKFMHERKMVSEVRQQRRNRGKKQMETMSEGPLSSRE